jgi:hypothetical protein
MKKLLAGFSLVVVLGLSLLLSGKAVAASTQGLGGVDLTTSPIATSMNGKPGTSATTTLQVQNNTSVAETIDIQLETFQAYGISGAPQIMPFAKSDPAPNWVHFSQNPFTAQPGVWTSIKMTVNLPKTASLGYYYAVIFKPQIGSTARQLGSTVKGGNAILVLVNATTANEHPAIQVTNFAADKKLYEYLPVNFSITVKNTGNIFLPPVGDIYISRSSNFSSPIDTISVNSSAGNVLPGTSRVFTGQWADGFPLFVPKTVDGQQLVNKRGQPEQVLRWNFANTNKLRFGKYYAELVLVYNNGDRDIPIDATVSFWVIPWKILSVALVVLVLTSVGLYVSGHKLAARTFNLSGRAKKRKFTNHDA